MTHNFRERPRYRRKFPGPIRQLVRPAKPCCLMRFPLRRHPVSQLMRRVLSVFFCLHLILISLRISEPLRYLFFSLLFRTLYFSPNHLSVIPPNASILRSRKNGQFRRLSSLLPGSHSTTNISSISFAPSASNCPEGSTTN